jgi:hypothetical protein
LSGINEKITVIPERTSMIAGTNVHHRIRCPINRGGLSNTTQFPFQSWRSSNGHADRSSGDNCFFRRGLRTCRWLSRRQALFSERSRMRDFPYGFPRPPKSSLLRSGPHLSEHGGRSPILDKLANFFERRRQHACIYKILI